MSESCAAVCVSSGTTCIQTAHLCVKSGERGGLVEVKVDSDAHIFHSGICKGRCMSDDAKS